MPKKRLKVVAESSGRIKTIQDRLDAVLAETRRLREGIDELGRGDENHALRKILREGDEHDPIGKLSYNAPDKDSIN